ncbi:MAG: hypothetical protein IT204_06015 [Fimbriimonadaceae bacterium]|nr:hypothetical protein [Fimbriimonadaceae bacterium]
MSALGLLLAALPGVVMMGEVSLLQVWDDPLPPTARAVDAELTAADGWLRVQVLPGPGRSGLRWEPVAPRDLTAHRELRVVVRNPGGTPVRVVLRVDDHGSVKVPSTQHGHGLAAATVPGGGQHELVVPLGSDLSAARRAALRSLTGTPWGPGLRPLVNGSAVVAVAVFVPTPAAATTIEVGPLCLAGPPWTDDVPWQRFFPFVDELGQYAHRDWPGKVRAAAELGSRREAEAAELGAQPRPADWDSWGGWAAGPQLPATGYFGVVKRGSHWWWVDPAGRLFWSHGAVRVGTRVRVGTEYRGTPLDDRGAYFTLPPRDGEYAPFFGTEPRASRGYYVDREGHQVYDYLEANLYRKYGPAWRTAYAERNQQRLASWGLNTIANSSDPAIYGLRRTPYTAVVYSVPLGREEFRIAASSGDWGKLPDPYDPGLRALVERTLHHELAAALGDPWCLGFFVDNELHWGDATHVAACIFASPATQPAKAVLVGLLQQQYVAITALNAAWGADYPDWAALRTATARPDSGRAAVRADLARLSAGVIDEYFRICRDAVKAAAPQQLYLGCRFAGGGNETVLRAAGRYCDVISINRYSVTLDDLTLPPGLDRPVVIGEFHFCAPDRGLFPVGLQRVPTQQARAAAYQRYVESGLRHPLVIGTHWFQYYDQPTGGRFDGENYQTGLLDTCDTPYPETIAAVRAVARAMYPLRAAAAAGAR